MLAVNILFIKLRNYLAITHSDLATNKIVIASFLLRLSCDFFSFCIWCVLFINLILWSLHFGKPRDHRGLFTFLNSACSYFVKNTSVYAHKQISVACSGDDSMWKWHSSNTSQMSKLQGCTAFVLGNMYIKD